MNLLIVFTNAIELMKVSSTIRTQRHDKGVCDELINQINNLYVNIEIDYDQDYENKA